MPEKEKPQKLAGIIMPYALVRQLRIFAALTDTTPVKVMIAALEQYLSNPENLERIQFGGQGMLEHMDRSGLGASPLAQRSREYLESLKPE